MSLAHIHPVSHGDIEYEVETEVQRKVLSFTVNVQFRLKSNFLIKVVCKLRHGDDWILS